MEAICFFAGIAFLYCSKLYAFLFILLIFFLKWQKEYIIFFVFGILIAYLHAVITAPQEFEQEVIKNASIIGNIIEIPLSTPSGVKFRFRIEKLNNRKFKDVALLSCYKGCGQLEVGQRYKLVAKLKIPHNLQNPGSFDYKSHLKARHIHWLGTVKQNSLIKLNQHDFVPIAKLRQKISQFLALNIKNKEALGVLQALTVSDTTNIEKSSWELFRRTGTIHLMVISGAHIGLIAGIVYVFLKWLLVRIPIASVNRFAIASILALMAAFFYALIAGFGIPAERALIVCFFMFLKNFTSIKVNIWQALSYALFIVLLIEPHSVLMPGFYLSFLAVCALVLTSSWCNLKGVAKLLIVQFGCLLGLMPFTFYWFSYSSLSGMVANLLAIPFVGFFIVPLVLVAIILGLLFNITIFLKLSSYFVTVFYKFLSCVDNLSLMNINFTFNNIVSVMSLSLLFLALLCWWRAVFLPLSLVFFTSLLVNADKLPPGGFRVDVLDVGQGLAVFVKTANHNLLYDTGSRFLNGSNMGDMVIIPYLAYLKIKKLDKLIISHSDLDHRGGYPAIKSKLPIAELLVENVAFYKEGSNCQKREPWEYDGVRFSFLPVKTPLKGKNNNSCVMRIENESQAIILTGDIEKLAENYHITHNKTQLKAKVMLVPHHSSKTSSGLNFLKQISPEVAISSYGFDNPYKFPHIEAERNYQSLGIKVLNTKDCGMVSILFKDNKAYFKTKCNGNLVI